MSSKIASVASRAASTTARRAPTAQHAPTFSGIWARNEAHHPSSAKIWVADVSTWPLIACMAAACGVLGIALTRNAAIHPDFFIGTQTRQDRLRFSAEKGQAIRDTRAVLRGETPVDKIRIWSKAE